MTGLDIIYEDEAVLVCYKPAGIATQTNRLAQQDMVSRLRNYRAGKGENPYIGLVHRLDQPVEGVMVFAKTPAAAADLSGQVAGRTIGKKYYALSAKEQKMARNGLLRDYLLFDKKANHTQIVSPQTPNAKAAELEYRILAETQEEIFFDITLHTGRHHQIRAQLAHMGCPILGDAKYGTGESEGTQLALCSYQLTFAHPATGERLQFEIAPRNPLFGSYIKRR